MGVTLSKFATRSESDGININCNEAPDEYSVEQAYDGINMINRKQLSRAYLTSLSSAQ